MEPTRFRNNIGDTFIFSLYTRTRKSMLALWRPWDEVVTKKHIVTRCGVFGVRTSTPISISIWNKFL